MLHHLGNRPFVRRRFEGPLGFAQIGHGFQYRVPRLLHGRDEIADFVTHVSFPRALHIQAIFVRDGLAVLDVPTQYPEIHRAVATSIPSTLLVLIVLPAISYSCSRRATHRLLRASTRAQNRSPPS